MRSPPITPPNLPEPSLLHLGDHEAGYHSLCHGLTPNGLLPAYSYQAMDLPAIMVSNMLAQDSHLLSGQLPTVSPCYQPWFLPGYGKEGRTLCSGAGSGLCRLLAWGSAEYGGWAWREVCVLMLLVSEALFIIY